MIGPVSAVEELRKRRREVATVVALIGLLLFLTWIELKLLGVSQQLPFEHSIFFFGLVNFNLIIVLLLFFLIFRNLVKVFVERQGKVIGSSLKGKLTAAFLAFALIPTGLMFLVSVFYINSSFDKWFSQRMASVLKNSLEVNQEYIFSAKKKNYHFAKEIDRQIRSISMARRADLAQRLESLRAQFSLDAVEYYPDLFDERVVVLAKDDSIPVLPAVSLELLRKAIVQRDNSSTIQAFSDGNIIRAVMPAQVGKSRGAIVVSSFIPFSFISRMDDITAAHEEFRNLNPLQYPLKSIYLVILVLMTLVILLCATWFGFHLARQLSGPLELLGLATRRVSDGDYRPVDLESGSAEINHLVGNFNQMTANLDRSQREVLEANRNLTQTLETLDEHSRYIQVVLANVTTGVLSVDANDRVITLNRHAEQLLGLKSGACVGRPCREVLEASLYSAFQALCSELRSQGQRGQATLQRETVVEINGQLLPLMVSLSSLNDERGKEWGRVMVFDDLTMLVNAQRAAAWTEVARRIAHEIKNPLTPIKLSAQRLEKRFGAQIQDPAFRSSVQMIIQQTDDLKRLVNEFSNFARLPQARPVTASLARIIDESVEIYRSGQADVSFLVEHDPQLPQFRFDPDQIRRVLINLIDNAVEALKGRTQPRVMVRSQYDSSLKLVRISVIDNGPGIPDADRERVFEPYFSTKDSGTGLGLAIVRRIVEDHNGFVRAIANEPHGTKVLVELPVLEMERPLEPGKSLALQVVGIDFLERDMGTRNSTEERHESEPKPR